MAQKITAEEARKLGVTPLGKKHPVRAMLEALQPGELLHITQTDFSWKNRTPSFFCNQLSKTGEKQFTVLKTRNQKGWVVERVV